MRIRDYLTRMALGCAFISVLAPVARASDIANYIELSNNGSTQHVRLIVDGDPFIHLFFRLGGTPSNGAGNQSLIVSNVQGQAGCAATPNPPNQVGCAFGSSLTHVDITFDVTRPEANNDTSKLVLDNPGGGARALFVPGPVPDCKVIFYVSAEPRPFLLIGHGFVQIRPATGPIITAGFIPTTLNFFGGPGIIQDEARSPWNLRLVYHVTPQQCDAAKNRLATWKEFPPPYFLNGPLASSDTFPASNCMGLLRYVADGAGLTLPNFVTAGVPDPRTLAINLNLTGDGNFFNGGLVQRNTNNLSPTDTPDPPPPVPEVGSPSGLALRSLIDGTNLGMTLGFRRNASILGNASLPPGGMLRVQRSGLTSPAAEYAIDWGDGSEPETLIKPFDSAMDPGPVQFSHQYTTNGTFTNHLIALTGGGIEEYQGTVTVGSTVGTRLQTFTVPAPPPPRQFIDFLSQSDCLFDWAQGTYPNLFSPVTTVSNTLAPYYYRYYPQTQAYLGTSSADGHVYYLANNSLFDVGDLSGWLTTAGCQ